MLLCYFVRAKPIQAYHAIINNNVTLALLRVTKACYHVTLVENGKKSDKATWYRNQEKTRTKTKSMYIPAPTN